MEPEKYPSGGSAPSWRALEALHAQGDNVVHGDGFVGIIRLPIPGSDQRSVVGVLGFDQRVEVLAGGEDLTRRLGAVELAGVAPDRRQLALELSADVHHEGR